MKDAYSFHADEASLDESYNDMYDAYGRIFKRVGINARPVVADSGAIGGSHTHESVEFHHVFHLVHKQLQLFQYLRHSHFVHYRQSYLHRFHLMP